MFVVRTAVCDHFYQCWCGIIHAFAERLPEFGLIGDAHESEVVEAGGMFKVEVVRREEEVGERRLEFGDGQAAEDAAAVVETDDTATTDSSTGNEDQATAQEE